MLSFTNFFYRMLTFFIWLVIFSIPGFTLYTIALLSRLAFYNHSL